MNWTKPNFTQWVTIITLSVSAVLYLWRAENERVKSEIKQHDQEQRIDSIATAMAIFINEFRELQKNRAATTKQRDQEKQEIEQRTQSNETRLTIIEQQWKDFIFYKLKK